MRHASDHAARRSHPLAKVQRLADLTRAAWVLRGPAGGPGGPTHFNLPGRGPPPPRVRLECGSFSTLLALMPGLDVAGGLPRGFGERHGSRGNPVELPIKEALTTTTIHATSRSDRPLTLPAQRLLESVLQDARRLK